MEWCFFFSILRIDNFVDIDFDLDPDYGESSYIGPIGAPTDQPNSNAWVDGFDHQGFLSLTGYYASAFKTGNYPTITNDRIWLWARPHGKNAGACCDPVGAKPQGWDWVCLTSLIDAKLVPYLFFLSPMINSGSFYSLLVVVNLPSHPEAIRKPSPSPLV